MASERVILVDGSNLIFRAYFALPGNLMTSSGLHTNAIFGFANMFRKVLAGRTPTMGAVVFDAPGRTFREEKYPDYKADRPSMPGDLREQLPWIDQVVKAHNFPLLRVEGYEADDVIGTLTRQAADAGHEVFIISSDKDFSQLITDRVKMVDTLRDVTYDPELVRKKWGVRPDKFIDFLALVGDKIDNVPGIPGVGKKTAAQWLDDYGSLDGIYEHLGDIGGKRGETLAEMRDTAYLCRELVTIVTDAPLPLALEDLHLEPPDGKALNKLFVDLQFYSLISDKALDEASRGDDPVDYRCIREADEARAFVDDLLESDAAPAIFAVFDEEPPAISPLAGLAVATESGKARYLALRAPGACLGAEGLEILRPWLSDPEQPKLAHDFKRIFVGLAREGVDLAGLELDVMLASFLIDPTRLIPHRLDQLTKEFLHRTVRPAKSVVGSGKSLTTFGASDAEETTAWACHLADAVISMAPEVRERLEAEQQVAQLVERDQPLSVVLGRMELHGILVDTDDLQRLGVEFREILERHTARVYEIAGKEFNIRSTKQLSEVLFEDLGLPVIKRTKTGYSTAQDVLEKLATEHDAEIAQALLECRKFEKLINTYTDVLQAAVYPETGRIHATFQQTVGATGRLITTDPDLQRTPVTTAEGERIRRAFIAPTGQKIISADWSQIELRLLAHFSGDPQLVEAFTEARDIHRRTASRLFGVDLDAVTPEMRRVGKTVNFATIYGQGATALSQMLGVPRSEAKRYIARYFETYAGVRTWLDRTIAEGHDNGYVQTLFGRRRTIPELSSNNVMDRQAGERIAANTPIQGSAADICKQVMLEIPKRFEAEGLKTAMVLQIHDELLFECPEEELDAASAIIRERMEHVVELSVPLVVDVGVGDSWAEAH